MHAATLKASDSCFELKRLCATVLVPIATLVSVFTDKRLNDAVFMSAVLVIVAFWLADAVGYFHQRKLREAMTAVWVRRAARCPERYDHVPVPEKVGPIAAAFKVGDADLRELCAAGQRRRRPAEDPAAGGGSRNSLCR